MDHPKLLKKCKDLLTDKDYEIVSNSVNDKNQTRFIHLALAKDDTKYFAKVNLRSMQKLDLQSEALSAYLSDGKNFSIVRVADTIAIDQEHMLQIYPFIEYPAINNEHDDFKSFNIESDDYTNFYDASYEMISSIEKSSLYSLKDLSAPWQDSQKKLVEWLKSIDPSTSAVSTALQLLAQSLPEKIDLAPAVGDIQPQNLFWDKGSKHLYLFDLEAAQNMPPSYDYAKLGSGLYIVSSQPEIAIGWLSYCLEKLADSTVSSVNRIAQLHAMLLWTGLDWYCYFKKIGDLPREESSAKFLKWCLDDFVRLANEKN